MSILERLFGTKRERDVKALLPLLHEVNRRESWATSLPDHAFAEKTREFKQQIQAGRTLDDILPEAFALVREAARRKLGERLYDVQILGAIVLHQGKITEMKTGEGKTLASVPAAYLNSLTGRGVHIVTVNDYLAERDANWMKPVYDLLGVSVGAILSQMDTAARKEAYAKDITYGTNNEFGFDYLRDNMCYDISQKVQRGHVYCIVDEIDSILIDEARTPLIISGPAEDDRRKFLDANRIVPFLQECEKDPETGEYLEETGDYKIDEKGKRVMFTTRGLERIEELLLRHKVIQGSLFSEENFEYIHYVTQACRAHFLFHKDVDYVVKEGQVQIVDEFTGRILHGRRYSDGLHQALEAKEGIRVAERNRTLATITFQNYFRMYEKLAGMTGTAETEAKEFAKIYGLEVVVIPTNRPVRRIDDDDLVFLNEEEKLNAICDEIVEVHRKGQPILVGTISIEKSETLSTMLKRRGVPHEVLNAKNHAREALIIAEAGAKGAVTIATNMAGRGTDIKLGGSPEFRARKRCGTDAAPEDYLAAYEEELKRWERDYEEVKALGGLYVIGTERHESRRIDNQLRGRSGRQGDPGRSRFFISMDDSLMRLFGGGNLKQMMVRVGMQPGEPINHPLINRSIERAQQKVEERNFEIRKHLLEYDDVLNEQRKFIYAQRDDILTDTHLLDRVRTAIEDLVDEALEHVFRDPHPSPDLLLRTLQEHLYYAPPIPDDIPFTQEALRDHLLTLIDRELREKEEKAGKEALNLFLRFEYLRNIDQGWQEHLEQMEALREAVYLRVYGQKNPLLEYKLEGSEIFEKMIYRIRAGIARKLLLLRIEERPPVGTGARRPQRIQAVHQDFSVLQPAGAPTRQRMSTPPRAAQPAQATVRRTGRKIGRNEPCPCGSGKKYKHCCGR
ncbi:preprotein translocase subunit SecA [Spirochaeta thermophila]|uniref:Protein translocase subunit SecA n=1 Tax=Winmispira thermophila (strain ATCC 49972 / DSM 6192 / RI 19.B1) TaxID=665571 RepID=E0RRJ8_WINT6|nr:preprotein translocase subunit SecA [Spirochaeta thermophila]ADN01699.1 protein translocase subunit SecA [Spirochaeta thermophila DSM 6192]